MALIYTLEFADDLSRLNRYEEIVDNLLQEDSEKLHIRNFIINQEKTEKYKINTDSDDSWKKVKYLGSLLGTKEDITRRKQLAMMSYNKYKNILESNKISLKFRIGLFNVYIASIFLYNSELWTLTKKLNNAIDIFQRALLKKMLKIHYPFIIRNETLYSRVQQNK